MPLPPADSRSLLRGAVDQIPDAVDLVLDPGANDVLEVTGLARVEVQHHERGDDRDDQQEEEHHRHETRKAPTTPPWLDGPRPALGAGYSLLAARRGLGPREHAR